MATTGARRAGATPSKPRQSGTVDGRPKGLRARLITEFVTALVEDFARNGKAAIRKARESSPVQYLRLIGALVPSNWFGNEPEPEAMAISGAISGAVSGAVPVTVAAPRHEMVRSPHRFR